MARIVCGASWLPTDSHRAVRDRRTGTVLFHLLAKLYETTSVVLTTNLGCTEWSGIFGDARMTTALLDRPTHHCHIVETGNDSWRFRHSSGERATARSRTRPRKD